MNALSLYSGGCDGMGIAAAWSGINTLAYCDSEEACRALLRYRHPNKPIFESDTEVTCEALRQHGIDPGTIDMVYGAPPCQCASVAGQRLGAADPRNRWPQFLRIVSEIRPRWVMAENVPGLLSVDAGRLYGDILRALAEAGYTVGWQCWSAADVGAPHKRERLFIVAHASGDRCEQELGTQPEERRYAEQINNAIADSAYVAHAEIINPGRLSIREGAAVAELRSGNSATEHSNGERCKECNASTSDRQPGYIGGRYAADGGKRAAQPKLGRDLARLPAGLDAITARLEAQNWPAGKGPEQYPWEPPRVATGIPDRATRLKMIGNACPPQQYYIMMAQIAEQNLIRA